MGVAKAKTEEKARASRILMIDAEIRSGAFPSIKGMAEKAEVAARTIERDLEYLRDMRRAPIEYDRARGGYYYSEPDFYIKSLTLTEGELFSVALFDRLLEQYDNTPLAETLRGIFTKIAGSMPERITVGTAGFGPRLSFVSEHQGRIDAEVFSSVFEALKTVRTIRFDYRSLQETHHRERAADPYHAICQRGNWYFIGHCHDSSEARMFSFARARNVTLTNKHFTIPSGFRPEDYFDKDMGVFASARTVYTVELLAADEIATFALERQWHKTQTVEQRKDGSVYIKFTTTQMPEVLRWVLGQGHTVKALAPPELVEMVKAEAEKVRGMYE